MAEYAIITGLSGAGRSQAGANLEDQGWFVIDNMPTALITRVAELVAGPAATTQRIALVVGRDAGQISELQAAVAQLRSAGDNVRVLFLEASDEVLVRRFEGTRRRHPLGDDAVTDAIDEERRRLEPIREMADLIIDTSSLNVHELRERMGHLFGVDGAMHVSVVSFGFKHGVPLDVDNLFDCRFLPNPHWDEHLRPLTGLDDEVRRFVLDRPEARELVERIDALLELVVPASLEEGKAYCTVAVGCTGGRHRSVAVAEELATRIEARGFHPSVFHRDLDR